MTMISLSFITWKENGGISRHYSLPPLQFAAIAVYSDRTVYGDPAGDLSGYPVFTMDTNLNRSARPGEKVIFNAARR
jgi:hypothetical protein